jgi:tetratricopeptide (TPR) repeat protein
MIRRTTLLLTSLVVCLLAGVAKETLANSDAARRAAKTAEVFVARDDFKAAVESLSTVNCQGDVGCQTLVDFTYAWVYESWAGMTPEQSRALLTRALNYYQRARKASPENTQILTNLALVAHRLGDFKTAAGAMTDVIKLNPDDAYQSYLFLGEVLQSAGDDRSALRMYHAAVKTNPHDAKGHQRLLDIYRKTGSAKDLFKYSMRIRRNFPDLAATGFESAIGLLYKEDAKVASQSLAMWTAIRSNLGALSAVEFEQLPTVKAWNFTGLRQLRRVVMSDKGPPSSKAISWWTRNALRQDAMARLLRLKATRLIATAETTKVKQQDRIDAQRIAIAYLTAAVEVAPQYHHYLDGTLAGSSNAKLDAATNLVTLHHSLKAGADPQGLSGVSESELSEMTDVLFYGKGGAYAAGQLSDIQRYHTVLGMIYYETRRDKSGGADNAIFQLSHALKTAEKIADQKPEKYEPLPELQLLLAKVYQRQGQTADAARESLSAAMGFLEKDDLPKASKALVSAKQKGANTAAVSTILQGRQAVMTEGAALLKAQPGSDAVSLDPKISWLKNPDALNLPKKFVEGQQFKTLADLGNQLTSKTDKALANSVNRLALDAASKNQVLTSPSDVKRIQRLETNFRQSTTQTQVLKPVKIEGVIQPSPSKVDQPSWTLPSKQGTLKIQIDPRLLNSNTTGQDKKKLKNQLKIDRKNLQVSPVLKQ